MNIINWRAAVGVRHEQGSAIASYRFAQKGDGVGFHEHPYAHYAILISGSIEYAVGNDTGTLSTSGSRLDFPAGLSHAFVALERGTVVETYVREEDLASELT